jgi:hypothetical protein
LTVVTPIAGASTDEEVQARLTKRVDAGEPIVVHVVVALCDNENQGIVPVKKDLGNGQAPRSNLYWGALYGVRTHLSRAGGWQQMASDKPKDDRVLDRVVFRQRLPRGETEALVYVVADAWDGKHIKPAIERFLEMAAGRAPEVVRLTGEPTENAELSAGGSAQLAAYVGHNGLMDFSLPVREGVSRNDWARSSIVLACASKDYFLDHLNSRSAHPLLLTTGLMAPEAYTLDSAIRAWAGGSPSSAVKEAAAQAYHQYQHCGMGAARRLFWTAR